MLAHWNRYSSEQGNVEQGGKKLMCELIHKNLLLHQNLTLVAPNSIFFFKKSGKKMPALKGREESGKGYDKDSPRGYQHSTAPRALRALW